ncbi:MAG: hypothetical protein ABWK04_05865 [Hydrogenobacter sp.]
MRAYKEIDRPVPETFLDALGEGLERIAYAFLIGVNSKEKKKKEEEDHGEPPEEEVGEV